MRGRRGRRRDGAATVRFLRSRVDDRSPREQLRASSLRNEHVVDVQGVLVLLVERDPAVANAQQDAVQVAVVTIVYRAAQVTFGLERDSVALGHDGQQPKMEVVPAILAGREEL